MIDRVDSRKFNYDEGFWGNFNVIPPEEKLNEAIVKI